MSKGGKSVHGSSSITPPHPRHPSGQDEAIWTFLASPSLDPTEVGHTVSCPWAASGLIGMQGQEKVGAAARLMARLCSFLNCGI